MKITEFLHKNEPKSEISKGKKLMIQLLKTAFYILLLYMFGKAVYGVVLGMRLTSKILGF